MFANASNLSELIFDIEDGKSVHPIEQDRSSYYWFWHICSLLVRGHYHQSIALLLAYLPLSDSSLETRLNCLWIYYQLACLIENKPLQLCLSKQLIGIAPFHDWRRLHILCNISRSRQSTVHPLSVACEFIHLSIPLPPHLEVEYIYYMLSLDKKNEVASRLSSFKYKQSCDYRLLTSAFYLYYSRHESAKDCLVSGVKQFAHRFDYAHKVVELLFDIQSEEFCLPVLKYLLPYYNHSYTSSRLLERYAQAMLLQRKYGPALRTKLLERLPIVSGSIVSNISSLVNAYSFLGRSHWLEYLCHQYRNRPDLYPEMHENLLMYLSSRASFQYPQVALMYKSFIEDKILMHSPSLTIASKSTLSVRSDPKLRIGWICGDITNHPVSRFIYSWLSSLTAGHAQHQHFVISTFKPTSQYADLFDNLEYSSFYDISHCTDTFEYVKELRSFDFDIAIDLNGWTGNNIMSAFISRIAPIQINYLAYHASSGIDQMDYWLIDNVLLPSNLSKFKSSEWHSETLLRLDRPFLAWQPPSVLPEGKANVTQFSGPLDSSIHYGCFNNCRKISPETLHTWSLILRQVSDSRLVLKAFESDDPDTSTLLCRRLVDSGISLDKVIFLPYTSTPSEHLLQYSKIDVALDCHPNSGCTTSCEALWMGVPVVTLTGIHYVSRMSHSVLAGIGLNEWITYTQEEYIKQAVDQAHFQRLNWLRQNRSIWRNLLQKSKLGDASDLMHHLNATFEKLYSKHAPDL